MNILKRLFRKRRTTADLELLACHLVILSENLEGIPQCENLCKMAERELYKMKIHYPDMKRPSLEEAKVRVQEHVAANPKLYSNPQ